MDPMHFLTTRNGFKRRVMHAIAREAQRLRLVEMENQAQLISSSVMKGLGGK